MGSPWSRGATWIAVSGGTRQRAKLQERIRRTDDLDKKCPTVDLLDALVPLAVTRNALVERLWGQTSQVSLRDLMDLTIPETADPTPGYLTTPLLDVRCIGERGFWSIVNRLTGLDLGKRTNEYWRRKLTRLARCWRIRGASPHAWSKPLQLPRTE